MGSSTRAQQLTRVELPMAVPYVMSGIRIAAVSAVSTMTIAAFAGANGLGWFIVLGMNSRNYPLTLMGAVAAELADLVVVTSDNPRTEGPEDIIEDILPGMEGMDTQCHVEPDRPEAICWALSQARPGDVVVLAGKGHETYQEINGVQYHLDEREEIAAYFA